MLGVYFIKVASSLNLWQWHHWSFVPFSTVLYFFRDVEEIGFKPLPSNLDILCALKVVWGQRRERRTIYCAA